MVESFRLLVTGSRVCLPGDVPFVRAMLDKVVKVPVRMGAPVVVVQGQCPHGGVDLVAEQWCNDNGFVSEPRPANWLMGKQAGPLRNIAMVADGADVCLAFPGPGSRGTWHCVQKAVEQNIKCLVYPIGAYRGTVASSAARYINKRRDDGDDEDA